MEEMFKEFDQDHSGSIDKQEMYDLIKKLPGRANRPKSRDKKSRN